MRLFRSTRLSARGGRSGFTLIEIMMVVAIGLLVLGMGLPPFVRGMKKEGLRKGVSDMVEACSHARAQAILRGRPVELVIRENGAISVEALQLGRRADPEAMDQEPLFSTGPAESRKDVERFSATLSDDVAIKLLYVNFQDLMEEPEARVRFFPNGTSDEFTVILFASSGEHKISLDVVTALADVEVIR